MTSWYYICLFILAILVLVRGVFNFTVKLFSPTPTKYVINKEERWLLGLSLSYILTYLIY
jgi:hypothetical protein